MLTKGLIPVDGVTYAFRLHRANGPTAHGIEGGRIEKLRILRNNRTVCLYKYKWLVTPTELGAEKALTKLLLEYNG